MAEHRTVPVYKYIPAQPPARSDIPGPRKQEPSLVYSLFPKAVGKQAKPVTIFKEALEALDHLEVFPRANGKKPVLLVDGHGSRFGLDFLEYINDPAHL